MSTAAVTLSNDDTAFNRNRKTYLVYPLIVFPFITALFWILGGGKGERYLAEEEAAGRAGSSGFNASMPNAKGGSINGREIDNPAYGKAAVGQVLSAFTASKHDSAFKGIKELPVKPATYTGAADQTFGNHASSLATGGSMAPKQQSASYTARPIGSSGKSTRRSNSGKGYYYVAPGTQPNYYAGSGTDQQIDAQLRSYQAKSAQPVSRTGANQPVGEAISTDRVGEDTRAANVLVSDNLTATRLSESANSADAFFTAPTSGSRRQAERAVLSGGNSYGSKKTVAWMIPVVVHEDQTFKSGNTVKLRLTKEISADGITIPANTILHAICQTSDDRLRMVVRSLQLNGQLIPLDLEVYDIDGIAGVNMPGLSNPVGGQLQSSAIQGLQVPGVGGLVNTVANQARMSASNSARQPTVRLKAGYNLYLKAQ
ncbi:conjugative transposon protein TraM [Spirosoma horti]